MSRTTDLGAADQDGIPSTILALQRDAERLFIAAKAQERTAVQLLGQRPQDFVRPARPSVLWRAVMRVVPAAARYWQAKVVGKSGLFDAAWYLASYGDVKAAKVDPLQHFLRFGAAEGRDPGPLFSSAHYLRLYPDVKAAGVNPLVHYLQSGWYEKRSIHPLMPEGQA